METLAAEKTHCDTCGKNLRVIRQSKVIRVAGAAFCSAACQQRASDEVKTYKLSKAFGGAEINRRHLAR